MPAGPAPSKHAASGTPSQGRQEHLCRMITSLDAFTELLEAQAGLAASSRGRAVCVPLVEGTTPTKKPQIESRKISSTPWHKGDTRHAGGRFLLYP